MILHLQGSKNKEYDILVILCIFDVLYTTSLGTQSSQG